MAAKRVLIVGGVAAGASTAARLRRLDENAEIILFEKGEYISFANCGLPYYVGGIIKEKSALTVHTPRSFKRRFNIDARVFNEVVAIDTKEKCVTVKNLVSGEIYNEYYDHLVLSMGAEPVVPDKAWLDYPNVFTLRNIPDTYRIKEFIDTQSPKTAVIAGGGYIGLEMAENLAEHGIEVTIVQRPGHLIAGLDYDMACQVHEFVRSKGVNLILNESVNKLRQKNDRLLISLKEKELEADMLLLSLGIKPSTKIAQEAGIELNSRGFIKTNSNMMTSAKDVYAAGDAVEINHFVTAAKASIALAGPANRQGRIIADNICGIKSEYNGVQGSAIIKIFDMTVAMTGINESTAKLLNLPYDKCYTQSPSHAGYYPGSKNMTIKTIFDKTSGRIYGAQLVGYEGVDKRCDVLAAAMRFGATAFDLTELDLCYAPPFSSAKDPVNMAGYVIEDILTGKAKYFHWHDVDKLIGDKDITLLDVRTETEYKLGHIEGFINIPVDDIRGRIKELDSAKPVYIMCHTAFRAYIASSILRQKGFDCYIMGGGYSLYSSIFGKPVNEKIVQPETQMLKSQK